MKEDYVVPVWCGMHPDEHNICGGCWGIGIGDVEREGEKYCMECEHHKVYYRLYITAPDSEIWVGDDEGNLVQKEDGVLDTRLLPGKYTVQFGLGHETKFDINLQKDTELTVETIQKFRR